MEARWLAAALSALAIAIMVGLGFFTIQKYRALQLDAYGAVGSAYIDGLLAPYAFARLSRPDEPYEELRIIDSAMLDPAQAETLALLRIWLPDGTLLYSSDDHDAIEAHDAADMRLAFTGETVTRLDLAAAPVQSGLGFPHFEIYAPIHDPVTGTTIAVGEIYQNATQIIADRAFVERMVWTAMVLATFGVLALLALSFRQSDRVRRQLVVERQLVIQNRKLHAAADQARLDAVESNEQVLNLVGAELHDGPVQLLGLMSLMDGRNGTDALPDGTDQKALTDQVLSDLRKISSGLILPELGELDPRDVVELAAARHRGLVAQDVELRFGDLRTPLDLPHKVCLYRIVQEGLTNAFRHASGRMPVLSVREADGLIEVEIRSGLGRADGSRSFGGSSGGLGLQGMRRRLDALGGTVTFEAAGDEAVLHATLPVSSRVPAL
jgi:signal transduction histidine kinase